MRIIRFGYRRSSGPFGRFLDLAAGLGVLAIILALVFFVVLPVVGMVLTVLVALVAGALVVGAIAIPLLRFMGREGLGQSKISFSQLHGASQCSTGRLTIPAASLREFRLENQQGQLDILGYDGDECTLETSGGQPFAFEVGSGVAFVQRQGRDTVDFRVKVPHGMAIHLLMGKGGVELRGHRGEFHLKAGFARVEWDEVEGAKSVHLGAGNVQGRHLKGDVNVTVGRGDVSLSYAAAPAAISVQGASVSLDLTLPQGTAVNLQSAGCRVQNECPNSGAESVQVTVRAAAGNIRIRNEIELIAPLVR